MSAPPGRGPIVADWQCPSCGFALRGLPVKHRCPECGRPFAPGDFAVGRPRIDRDADVVGWVNRAVRAVGIAVTAGAFLVGAGVGALLCTAGDVGRAAAALAIGAGVGGTLWTARKWRPR